MNYLLNKTKVKDVMIRDVVTVSGYASLEDATYLMLKIRLVFFLSLITIKYTELLRTVTFSKPFLK